MATLPLYQVDAFTSQPFSGNPAGVVLLTEQKPDEWMKEIAREMNLSETAFLLPENDAYRLRWFTPAVEVTLCGHATLASAHTLWEQGILSPRQTAKFETLSGRLTAERCPDGWIAINFPARVTNPVNPPNGLLAALGINNATQVGRYTEDYLVEVESEDVVRSLSPDFIRLKEVESSRGVVVTARSKTPGFDIVSRFFAPAAGVNEDPVTGSAHCALAPYWAGKLNKSSLRAYQASSRGGELRLQNLGERVQLEGQAITIFEASLQV
jgi:PhzF family phenazine biosynthesis protein